MIEPVKIGDLLQGGCVDRVINIHWGSRRAMHNFDCIEYECLFRVNGKWYTSLQCDGPNGGDSISLQSNVTDSNAEAFAEEKKTYWRKLTGKTEKLPEKPTESAKKSERSKTRHGKLFKSLLERFFEK